MRPYANILRAELHRWIRASMTYIVALSGLAFTVLVVVANGSSSVSVAGSEISAAQQHVYYPGLAMAGTMFAAIGGILIVAEDISSGYLSRMRMVDRSAIAMVAVKMLSALMVGVIVALFAVSSTYGATWLKCFLAGGSSVWQADIAPWMLRYCLVYALYAAWGCALGFLLRRSFVAVTVQCLFQAVIENALISAFPDHTRWLLGNAMYALAGDPRYSGGFPFLGACAVVAVWVGTSLMGAVVGVRWCAANHGERGMG